MRTEYTPVLRKDLNFEKIGSETQGIISALKTTDVDSVNNAQKRIMELRLMLADGETSGYAGAVLTQLQTEISDFELVDGYIVLNETTFNNLIKPINFVARSVGDDARVLYFDRSTHEAKLSEYRWYFGLGDKSEKEAGDALVDDLLKERAVAGSFNVTEDGLVHYVDIDVCASTSDIREIKSIGVVLLEGIPEAKRASSISIQVRQLDQQGGQKYTRFVFYKVDNEYHIHIDKAVDASLRHFEAL